MFLHKFDIFRNERAVTGTKVAPTVTNLPANDEITRLDGTNLGPVSPFAPPIVWNFIMAWCRYVAFVP
jgi:hypothetical protein